MDASWIILLKGAVYVLAFWLFGWKIVHRRPLPSLGWALLGGLGRWLGGLVLGALLFVLLTRLKFPLALVIVFFAVLRFSLWAASAGFLYAPAKKPLLHFSLVMTLLNFGIDLVCYGPPQASEFMEPISWNFH